MANVAATLCGDQIVNVDLQNESYRQLSMDAFAVVSNWYHYAILDLISISGAKPDPAWLGRSLSITTAEAKSAVARLKRLGLLIERDGRLLKTQRNITNEYAKNATSAAHKAMQRSVLEMALSAIDNIRQEEKDITSMTMAIDESKLSEAREIIRHFRQALCKYLETGNQSRVYHLAVQLYPVSNRISDQK